MKNILVVGADFVGTHLVDHLINQNYKVTVYDLFLYEIFLNRIKIYLL